jgi:hypothetical protein
MPVPELPIRWIVMTWTIVPLGMERDPDRVEGKGK